MVVNQTMINHTLILIKSIQIVVMVIKSFAVMTINTQNQFRFIEVKMLYTTLWKKCLKRLNIVKMSSNTNSKSH